VLAYQKVSHTENGGPKMRMIHWMCGHTRFDKIIDELIGDEIGVASVDDKIREARLRWFDHIGVWMH